MKASFEEMELRIDYVRRVACPPSWSWDSLNQKWSGIHLWAVAGGVGRFKTPRSEHELSRGDCFVLRPPERYIGSHDPKRPLVVLSSTFRFFDPRSGEPWSPSDDELSRHKALADFGFFESLYGRCLSAWEGNGLGSRASAKLWLSALLREFKMERETPASPERGSELEEDVLKLAAEMKENPGADHSLERLARSLGRSKNQALRLFKRFAGTTPGALLLSARLDAAKSLLLYSSLSAKEIAAQLGYCDQFAFSKQFKTRFGMAPLWFRNRASGRSA